MANLKKEKLNNLLISRNGEATSPIKVMVSIDGKATKAIKCYAGIDGVAKLVFPGEKKWSPNEIVLQSTYTYTTSTTDITIENKWDAPIIVTRSDTGESHTLEGRSVTDSSNLSQVVLKNFQVLKEISIQEGEKDAFRKWDYKDNYNPLVRGLQLFKCTMPDMNVFTEDEEGTILPSGAFYQFNCNGAIQRFNDGAFLTDNITTMDGSAHFAHFNYQGQMLEHPPKAFCFPKVTSVGSRFMESFNYNGNMYYIANDAFDTRSITSAGSYYLQWFNGMIATSFRPPGESTTYTYSDGALGQSSNGSPVFVNNSPSSITVVYRGNSREWTTIPKGGKMNFNSDPNTEAERQPMKG